MADKTTDQLMLPILGGDVRVGEALDRLGPDAKLLIRTDGEAFLLCETAGLEALASEDAAITLDRLPGQPLTVFDATSLELPGLQSGHIDDNAFGDLLNTVEENPLLVLLPEDGLSGKDNALTVAAAGFFRNIVRRVGTCPIDGHNFPDPPNSDTCPVHDGVPLIF